MDESPRLGTINSYRIAAKYYDGAYASMRDLTDAPFYLELARERGGPVLEIGCGTGRVLLPIARAGIEIHGVDNSGPMLAVLKDALDREPPEVRDRVTLQNGDMREFRLHQKFSLVTIPFRPMQHMHTVADQIAALTTAAAHVAEGGILAFDVFYPKFERLLVGIGEEQLEAEWSPAATPDLVIRRYFRKDVVDKINQTYSLTFIFRSFREGKLIAEDSEELKMSYYFYPHLRALFLLAGLEVVAEYGSFTRAPLDNTSQEMIFLLRPARS
jgi:SAM-dependent methyltransferase